MHLEFLVEDSSGAKLLEILIPQIIGGLGKPHSWRIHAYKGVGRIPKNIGKNGNAANRILLERLPQLLRGYGRTHGVDAVVVVLDSDRKDCREFLVELQNLGAACVPCPQLLFRLAIEEIEAWYFGDRKAVVEAYPKTKQQVLNSYVQDSICSTWEKMADAVHPGGSAAIVSAGWPLPGQVKAEWAVKIGPLMDVLRNVSPSFCKFRDGLERLIS